MIVQTGVKVNTGFGLETPPDIRLYDIPDTFTVQELVKSVEQEHIRQLVQEVTGCEFTDEHLEALNEIAVRLVAMFKKEQQKFKFVSSIQQLPEPNRYVLIKTEPLYARDKAIYHINYRVYCNCLDAFRGKCGDLWWHAPFNFDKPFEWCYLDLETP